MMRCQHPLLLLILSVAGARGAQLSLRTAFTAPPPSTITGCSPEHVMGTRHRRPAAMQRRQGTSPAYNRLELRARPSDSAEDELPSSSLGEILLLVAPLLLIYISNQWSRYSISYLVDFSSSDATKAASAFGAMNVDLQFTESQYGLLASTACKILDDCETYQGWRRTYCRIFIV